MTPTNQPQDCNHVWGKEACAKCGKSRFYQPPAETEPGKSVELDAVLDAVFETGYNRAQHEENPQNVPLCETISLNSAKAAIELLIEERETALIEVFRNSVANIQVTLSNNDGRNWDQRVQDTDKYLERLLAQLPKPLKEDK